MRKIDSIIVHCSATIEGKNFTAADINLWHLQSGWAGIGYHYVIDLDGAIEIGREIDRVGAHCAGHNQTSIGICYIGGLGKNGEPADTRTPAQKRSLKLLIGALRLCLGKLKVYGHRDFTNKACPCFDAQKEYDH